MKFLKYLFMGIFFAGIVHLLLNASCLEQNNPTNPTSTKNVDISKINEGASKVEDCFINADTAKLATVLTDASLDQYRSIFKDIIPAMKKYGEAFKSRKLNVYTEIFAEYEFSGEDGQRYTATFARQDDNSWKLIRF
jgi:hypothetical protein